MLAILHDTACFEHDDAVHGLQRRKSVCNGKYRAPSHHCGERVLAALIQETLEGVGKNGITGLAQVPEEAVRAGVVTASTRATEEHMAAAVAAVAAVTGLITVLDSPIRVLDIRVLSCSHTGRRFPR
jgi:hypothetical protein